VLDLCLGTADLVVESSSEPSNDMKLHRNCSIPLSSLPVSYSVTSIDQKLHKIFWLDAESL